MLKRLSIAITLILTLACSGGGGSTGSNSGDPVDPPSKLPTKGYFRATQPKAPALSAKNGLAAADLVQPVNRMGHATATVAGKVFITGGTSDTSHLHQAFDIATETFITVSWDSPIVRLNPAVVTIPGNRVFIFGGGSSVIEVAQVVSDDVIHVGYQGRMISPLTAVDPLYVRSHAAYWNGKIVVYPNVMENTYGEYFVVDPITFEYEVKTSNYLVKVNSSSWAVHPTTGQPFIVGGSYFYSAEQVLPSQNILTFDESFNVVKIGEIPEAGRIHPGLLFYDENHLGIYGGEWGAMSGTKAWGGLSSDVISFDLRDRSIAKVGRLQLEVSNLQMAKLQNGYSFGAGGLVNDARDITNAQQIYDHQSNLSGFTNVMQRKRNRFTISPLNNGRLLIVGGEGTLDKPLTTDPIAEIFEPQDGIYIKLPSEALPLGETYKLTAEDGSLPPQPKACTWTASAGTIQADGTFTAPESYSKEVVEVVATDATNPNNNVARAYVRLDKVVVVTSLVASDATNRTYTFSASVNWYENKSITWTTTVGTIDANGVLTVPEGTTEVTVTATSVAAPRWKSEFPFRFF